MTLRFPRNPPGRPGEGSLDVLEYELLQEKAAALARMGRRLEQALHALRTYDEAGTDTQQHDARREELVAAAGEALWFFVVQREVCGLRESEAVIEELGIPPEVRLRMGPATLRRHG